MADDRRDPRVPLPVLDGAGARLAIVVARFNSAITMRLLDGAQARAVELGVAGVTVTWVPGAYEIPLAARAHAASGNVDAVVCLGCVIRGETSHYDFVAGQAAEGIMRTGLDSGRPVIFSVLTTENEAQALARSDPDGHHAGRDGVDAAIEMVATLRDIATRSPMR
ncbi:MAG: 6,7-dimethyl-8-ribityllumazine synthase [Desertimonas sp.]